MRLFRKTASFKTVYNLFLLADIQTAICITIVLYGIDVLSHVWEVLAVHLAF